jgi:hypothetical protein
MPDKSRDDIEDKSEVARSFGDELESESSAGQSIIAEYF